MPSLHAALSILLVSTALASGCGADDRTWERWTGANKEDDKAAAANPPATPKKSAPQPLPPKLEDLPDDSALTNLPALIERQGLAALHKGGFRGQNLTIAVLDNGFAGLNHSRGVRLSPRIQIAKSPIAAMQETTHGVKMAEIVHALASGSVAYQESAPGPRILLMNTNGYSNFKDAIDQVIAEKVDIVLYAQVWEYGGNGDGGGFINQEVNRALAAGVLWVNAAGNLGDATYGGPVALGSGTDVQLPYDERYVRFTVPQNQTPIKATLAWNDFENTKDYQTAQDLDLVLEDANHQELGAGRLVQAGSGGQGEENFSAHAREAVLATLDAGQYFLRVEARSNRFDAQSRLRLTVDGEGVRMQDGTDKESVLIPADNAGVLTVGANDVTYSGRMLDASGKRVKPELAAVSEVTFSDGVSRKGTSAAAAIAVGTLAVYMSAYGTLDRADILKLIGNSTLAQNACSGKLDCLAPPVLRLQTQAAKPVAGRLP